MTFEVFVQFAPLQIPSRNEQGLLVKSNSAFKKGFQSSGAVCESRGGRPGYPRL